MDLFKFNTDDNKLCCLGILGVVVCVTTGIVCTQGYHTIVDATAIRSGYSRQTLPGHAYPEWVKQ